MDRSRPILWSVFDLVSHQRPHAVWTHDPDRCIVSMRVDRVFDRMKSHVLPDEKERLQLTPGFRWNNVIDVHLQVVHRPQMKLSFLLLDQSHCECRLVQERAWDADLVDREDEERLSHSLSNFVPDARRQEDVRSRLGIPDVPETVASVTLVSVRRCAVPRLVGILRVVRAWETTSMDLVMIFRKIVSPSDVDCRTIYGAVRCLSIARQ